VGVRWKGVQVWKLGVAVECVGMCGVGMCDGFGDSCRFFLFFLFPILFFFFSI